MLGCRGIAQFELLWCRRAYLFRGLALAWLILPASSLRGGELVLAGVTVTPHVMAPNMRYARDPDKELGARVQLFVRNVGDSPVVFQADSRLNVRDRNPAALLESNEWAWHDFPAAWPDAPLELAPGALTVWSFNGRNAAWGVGTQATLAVSNGTQSTGTESQPATLPFEIAAPSVWISAVTFLAPQEEVTPDSVIIHLANDGDQALQVARFRIWQPKNNEAWRVLYPQAWFDQFESWPSDRTLPARDKAIVRVATGPLPLGYAAIELQLKDPAGRGVNLWAHLRVKREVFDISGGWVQGGRHAQQTMTFEPFLKTLRRMHINTAHLADQFPGYSDQTAAGGLYDRYPLKYFNALIPTEKYETEEVLPRVHAVEFLGEPQYGGGRPVPPMEVWRKLAPYQATKLPTSITHSEERIWRYYAGLSDFPHYDAYRVCAPSPDAWFKYDRWGGKKIGWGAPLETIGDMCRSLRELNRPMPTAYWSQGPHHGWGPMWGRKRASPTPDELRLQAYHALASRITSLYWFNLSLPSLVRYRDTLDELTRVGREICLLDELYLTGDAYQYRRVLNDGHPDWDLASIVSPQGAVLFALDLDYEPKKESQVFEFKPARASRFNFKLPGWCRAPAEVFRVDADGTYDVAHELTDEGIVLSDTLHKVGIYVTANNRGLRAALEKRRHELLQGERALGFNPAGSDADFAKLVEFSQSLSAEKN